MSSPEGMPEDDSKGEFWLSLIGYGHRAEEPTRHLREDGSPILAKDFDTLCRAEAANVFTFLESADPQDPMYELYADIARESFDKHMAEEPTQEQS